MARQMEVVKIARSRGAVVSCVVQYLRADISKSVAALRKNDRETWNVCKEELRVNLEALIEEAERYLADVE